MPPAKRILTICGSLRAASSNGAALGAAALLAPEGMEVTAYDGLAALPAFNPDDDRDGLPVHPAVAGLRAAIKAVDALLISSPEYAHGVPGSLKNALDWMVSDPDFGGKPVALINTAPHAHHAQDQLRETLTMMSAALVDAACVTLPLSGRPATADLIAADSAMAAALRAALRALAAAA